MVGLPLKQETTVDNMADRLESREDDVPSEDWSSPSIWNY